MKYKSFLLSSFTFFLAVFLLGACKDQLRDYDIPSGEKANKTRVSVHWRTPSVKGKTVGLRAFLDEEAENIVNDFVLCVFSPAPAQELQEVHVFSLEDIEDATDLAIGGKEKPVTQHTGQAYEQLILDVFGGSTIAILANLESETIAPIEGLTAGLTGKIHENKEKIKQSLKAKVKTLADFRKLKIELPDYQAGQKRGIQIYANSMPLYGELEVKEPLAAPDPQGVIAVTVPLKHLFSKLSLNLVAKLSEEDLAKYQNPDLSFHVKSVEFFNLPANAYIGAVVDSKLSSLPAAEAKLFNSTAENFELLQTNTTDKVQSLALYTLANTRLPQQQVSSYADRDSWVKEDTSEPDPYHGGNHQKNIRFKNAPAEGTYLKIESSLYKAFDNAAQQRESYAADLTSYVHLGYVGEDVNNYEIEPNVSYTYNMEINGVQTIIKEVTKDTEDRPAYEGHVIHSKNDFSLDSHYDAVLLVFDKNEFAGISKDRIRYFANTPYSKGDQRDVHWIKFVSNEIEYARREKMPRRQGLPKIKPEDKNKLIINYPGTPHVWLIEQLVDELVNENSAIWSADGKAYITAFVDEFYYENNPLLKETDPDYNSETFKREAWKTFTNQPDREFYIYLKAPDDRNKDIIYSRDKMSSYTDPQTYIRQHSIITFYPKELVKDPVGKNNGEYIALGLEQIQDPNRYISQNTRAFEHSSLSHSDINGRYNYYSFLTRNDTGWRDAVYLFERRSKLRLARESSDKHIILDPVGPGGDFENFNARSACLAKNRDENGNGRLEPEEMKWYIPAVRELYTMYIADKTFPFGIRMLPDTELNKYYHFLSSTVAASFYFNVFALWMESGRFSRTVWSPVLESNAKYGSQAIKYFYGDNDIKRGNKGYPYYRCVRAMGNLKDKYTVKSETFWTTTQYYVTDYETVSSLFVYEYRKTEKPGYPCRIKVLLPPEALRSTVLKKGALPPHHQNDVWNLPTKSFDVAAACLHHNVREKTKGKVDRKFRDNQEECYWWSKDYIKNKLYDDPCTRYYYEKSDKTDLGTWRMPNMRELSIMFMTLAINADGQMYSANDDKYEEFGFRKFLHNVGEYDITANYSGFGRSEGYNCVFISSTTLSKKDPMNSPNNSGSRPWRDSGDSKPVEFYLGYTKGAGTQGENTVTPVAETLNSNNINGYIRCVRDTKE